jgi:hypothetical protein
MTGSNWYDPNSIYTADYYVDRSSYLLDILGNYPSRAISAPETFTGTSVNNDIQVSKYPYIDYSVMNMRSLFSTTGNGTWVYIPPQNNIYSGQLRIWPTIINVSGDVLLSGRLDFASTGALWGPNIRNNLSGAARLLNNPDLNPLFLTANSGINYGYYLSIMDSTDLYKINSFAGPTDFSGLLEREVVITTNELERWQLYSETFLSGTLAGPKFFSGTISGLSLNLGPGVFAVESSGFITSDYRIGVGVQTEDNLFALENKTYTPLKVYVNNKLATNITDYYKLEHPAFSSSLQQGTDYQFIHAGKRLYFNEAIDKEIKVDYRWMTDYVSVQGILRSNTPISPEFSPKVNEIRLLINNSVI